MIAPLLTVRINRRAIAAVVLQHEEAVVADGRHLSSRTDRAVPSAVRYVNRLIELIQPSAVVLDAPATQHPSTTRLIVDALEAIEIDE